jgi:hypothetical protein
MLMICGLVSFMALSRRLCATIHAGTNYQKSKAGKDLHQLNQKFPCSSIYDALAQPLHEHWPAAQGQEPEAPPQLHFVFLGFSETTCMSADSAVTLVVFSSEFLAQPLQAQCPGAQGQAPASAEQEPRFVSWLHVYARRDKTHTWSCCFQQSEHRSCPS